MNVLIYTGLGTSSLSVSNTIDTLKNVLGNHYDIIRVNSQILRDEPWSDSTALIVIPNGKFLKYHDEIKDVVNEKIRNYINNGGKYLGFGAGANYPSTQIFNSHYQDESIHFQPFVKLELTHQVLNNYNPRLPKEISLTLPSNELADQVIGYFDVSETNPHITTLAKYKNNTNLGCGNAAAIVQYSMGKGIGILSGVDLGHEPSTDLQNDSPIIYALGKGELLRRILGILGLAMTTVDTKISKITHLHASFQRTALADLWLRSVNDIIKKEDSLIKENQEIILIIQDNTLPIQNKGEIKGDQDPQSTLTKIIVHRDEPPSRKITPFFDFNEYFKYLSKARNEQIESHHMEFGSSVLYGEVMGSTQSFLDKNFQFSKIQPTGLVCVATQQIQGRGRGRNSWISPMGCLQFSVVVRHPIHIPSSSVVFIQYILALAVVEAVRSKKGYEEIPLKLKWPNDIYAQISSFSSSTDHVDDPKLVKIGGVLITSQFVGNQFLIIAGCGVNTNNSAPTISINDIISNYNKTHQTELPIFSQEELLSRILVKFESIYIGFCNDTINGQPGFHRFLELYYKRWLHREMDRVAFNDNLFPNNQVFLSLFSPSLQLRLDLSVQHSERTIGKEKDCDLVIPDYFNQVSGRHCTVYLVSSNNEMFQSKIKNYSPFGTFVNGLDVGCDKLYDLNDGDRVTLGPQPGLEFILCKNAKWVNTNSSENGHSVPPSMGRFEILEHKELGRGSFASVYLARDITTGVLVACKDLQLGGTINLNTIKRLLQEAEIMKKLDHPNIVSLVDCYQNIGKLWIFTDLMTGGDLKTFISNNHGKRGELSYREKCQEFSRQICDALEYLHSKNVMHRDIKPDNILLVDQTEQQVKITDFGLAKYFNPLQTNMSQVGTPLYQAPELFLFQSYSNTVDMWSFGAVVYHMLTGDPPFPEDNYAMLKELVINAEVDYSRLLISCQTLAVHFIQGLLNKNPNERKTAKEALQHSYMKKRSYQLRSYTKISGSNLALNTSVTLEPIPIQSSAELIHSTSSFSTIKSIPIHIPSRTLVHRAKIPSSRQNKSVKGTKKKKQNSDVNMWGTLQEFPNGKTILLNEEEYIIGRGEDCHPSVTFFKHIALSKQHAVISFENGKAYLRDTSTNGTWVQGEKLGKNKRKELHGGETIYFVHVASNLRRDLKELTQGNLIFRFFYFGREPIYTDVQLMK